MTKGRDSLADELDSWLATIPGRVDPQVEAVRQRIGRISRQLERVLATVAERHGLSVGDWEALSVLARSGHPESGLTPSEMGSVLALTSGTVSVRIERLLRSRLVERVPGADGRARPVRLTPSGRDVWGRATLDRTIVEARLVGEALGSAELVVLDGMLARVLARLEEEYGPAPRHDMTRGRAAGR